MTSVNGDDGRPPGPDHVFALMDDAFDALRRQLVATELPAPARGLRPSQLRLLSHTPHDGIRVTDLARRLGMTKQALGEFATVLERSGHLESVRDPADGRVRILRPTAKGRRASVATEQVIADLEASWRERLGAERWDELRAHLRSVATLVPPAT